MNTIKPQLNQSRHTHKFRNVCVYAGFLTLFLCFVSLTLRAEEMETEERPSSTEAAEIQTTEDTAENTDTVPGNDERNNHRYIEKNGEL